MKKFKLAALQIRALRIGLGSAFASDLIMVDGRRVGYMYRTRPRDEQDSGWAFFAGDEDEAYLATADNFGLYDVNTVANYDPEIVPLLDAPVGSAFFRSEAGFLLDPDGAPIEDD